MIGIVVPVHNEERYLSGCLAALRQAAADPALQGEHVAIHVVLDACTDASEAIVAAHAAPDGHSSVTFSHVQAHKVGVARAAGADVVLARGARWLAFTDADTRVSATWLSVQLGLDVDVVCGSVGVDDWSVHGEDATQLQHYFANVYRDVDGHEHIHGANLGLSADAYRRAGGFQPLPCHEDVMLVEALRAIGARFAWSAAPRVYTSARRDARARGGFGDNLLKILTWYEPATKPS